MCQVASSAARRSIQLISCAFDRPSGGGREPRAADVDLGRAPKSILGLPISTADIASNRLNPLDITISPTASCADASPSSAPTLTKSMLGSVDAGATTPTTGWVGAPGAAVAAAAAAAGGLPAGACDTRTWRGRAAASGTASLAEAGERRAARRLPQRRPYACCLLRVLQRPAPPAAVQPPPGRAWPLRAAPRRARNHCTRAAPLRTHAPCGWASSHRDMLCACHPPGVPCRQ